MEHCNDGAFKRYVPGPKSGGFARGSFIAWRRSERIRDSAFSSEPVQDLHDLYDFKGLVGEGGFGKVYSVQHRRTGEVVAIKTLPKDRVQEQELQLEVQFLKLADHPNAVRYYEAFEDSDNIHLVMEMCSGGSLSDHIKLAHDDFGPGVNEEELSRITIQMLQGVAYCHAHSVAHRDIKPQNLLFSCGSPGKGSIIPIACSGDGDAPLKLVDFGIAGVVRSDQPGKRLLTKSAGTKGFMAPEVLGAKPYDGCAADMFSIGAVMHNIMVGVPPSWDAEKQKYRFPGRVRWNSFSDDCQSLLDHLLHEEPALRPTAREALQHPWFKSMGVPALPQLCANFDGCFRRMHAFSQLSKLQQVLMYSMVAFAPLHNHHMEQLRIAFVAADTGDSSGISCFRFVELGRQYSDFSSAELRRMFSEANFSRTGKISYCEWLAAACPSDWDEATHDYKRRAFETLDVRRNGYICASDLCQMLPHVFDLDQMTKEIIQAFPQGHGKLTFEDFCKLVAGKSAVF